MELETRPMVALQADILNRLQAAARHRRGMSDPVFALDESKGSILVVFQVWAATAVLAAALGCWMFTTTLVRAGLDRNKTDIELVSVAKTSSEQLTNKVVVQRPKEKLNT